MFPIANGVPLRYPPVATWALIAANCVIFLFQLSLSPSELDLFLDRYALVPARYFDAGGFDSAMSATDYLPFVSNMFLHGGWRLRSNRRGSWLLFTAVSVLANRRHGSDPFFASVLRGAGGRFRRIVVSDAGAAGHGRMVRPVRRRRCRLVGSHRRLHRRRRICRPVAAASTAGLAPGCRSRHSRLRPLQGCLRRMIIRGRIS